MLNDLKGERVDVTKVKAHSKWWDVLEGAIPHWEYYGNMLADQAAKEAAKAAEAMAAAATFNKQLRTCMSWLKWIVKHTFEVVRRC